MPREPHPNSKESKTHAHTFSRYAELSLDDSVAFLGAKLLDDPHRLGSTYLWRQGDKDRAKRWRKRSNRWANSNGGAKKDSTKTHRALVLSTIMSSISVKSQFTLTSTTHPPPKKRRWENRNDMYTTTGTYNSSGNRSKAYFKSPIFLFIYLLNREEGWLAKQLLHIATSPPFYVFHTHTKKREKNDCKRRCYKRNKLTERRRTTGPSFFLVHRVCISSRRQSE